MATDRSRIKGLTVEIGGDASDLDKELKNIEKQSKKSNDELKEINESLKLDPTNTELLAQKQKVLASAIESASKKLETLKAAEKSAQEQLKKGDIGEEQFRALQRETIRAENQLRKLEQKLADTQQTAKDLTGSADGAADAVKDTGKAASDAAKKTDDLSDSLEDLKGKYQDARDAAKDAASDLGKIGATAIAAGAALLVPATGKEDALASIQAGTGASASEMVLLEEGVDDVYGEGYGEDLDDVADTMALIKQLSGETNSDALADLTKDAIALRDVFGHETQESMRTAKMLTDQFGLSYQESFNLIAQATQKGLNRNGDLLDILNEYSVHFKGLGYDAEGMLGVLESGAASGAFSLDKVGDAAKELKIRLLDTADSNTEALTNLNLDAEEYRKRISAGGPAAQQACSEVLNALLLMDDQVAQNEIGVALFGTMWEDLGVDAISSLLNVNSTMDRTKGTMQEIRDIKYGTTANEWKALGRAVKTELITPMGEKLLPSAKEFCSYVSENLDSLIPKVKTIATIAASMYVGAKAAQMVGIVLKLVQAYKALKTATLASNAAMAATPWGAIGAAIGLVVGAVVSLAAAEREAEEAAREHLRELKAAADEQTAAYRESAQAAMDAANARRDTAGAINDEYDRYNDLVEELDKLVDAEGNVLKGNEERVEFIRNTLSDAIGEEIQMVDGQIQKYGELRSTINDVIALKRGEALANKLESDYNETKDNLSEIQMKYEQANDMIPIYEQQRLAYANLQRRYGDHLLRKPETVDNRGDLGKLQELFAWNKKNAEYLASFDAFDVKFAEMGDVYANQQAARAEYDAAIATINLYENLTSAIYSGSADKILAAAESMETGMMTFAQGAAYTTLYDQAVELYQAHQNALKMSQNEGTTIHGAQLSEMKDIVTRAFYEAYTAALDQGAPQHTLDNLLSMLSEVGYAGHLGNLHEFLGSLEEYLAYLSTHAPTNFLFSANPGSVLGTNPWGSQSSISAHLSGEVGALSPVIQDYGRDRAEESSKITSVLERIYQLVNDLDLNIVIAPGSSGSTSEQTDKILGRKVALNQRGMLK